MNKKQITLSFESPLECMNNNDNGLDCQVQHILKQESIDDTLSVRAQASENDVTVKSSLRQRWLILILASIVMFGLYYL